MACLQVIHWHSVDRQRGLGSLMAYVAPPEECEASYCYSVTCWMLAWACILKLPSGLCEKMHVRDILNACFLQMHAYFNEMLCKVDPMHGVLMRFIGYLVCKDSQIYLHHTAGMFFASFWLGTTTDVCCNI